MEEASKKHHRDPEVASSHAKIDENFANYFLKTKYKYFLFLK